METTTEEVGLLHTEMAPIFGRSEVHHVMLLYHRVDHDWVFWLAQKIQSPSIGLQRFCQDGRYEGSDSMIENVIQALQHSRKTVLVFSRIFLTETWPTCVVKLGAILGRNNVARDRLVVIVIDDSELPACLSYLPCVIQTSAKNWYQKLLDRLKVEETEAVNSRKEKTIKTAEIEGASEQQNVPFAVGERESNLVCPVSVIGVQPGLYNGYLLCSLKSRCGWCGKQYVDIKEIPPDFASHGIQIPEEEFRSALDHLFRDGHFTCYLWCYNLPVTVTFFAALLGLCLAVIPLVDTYAGLVGHQTGVEYVLATVVWMCVLTVYLIVLYMTRKKMKLKTYRRLSSVNAIMMKRQLLAGFEQLGLADCNRYFIHFFYYDASPCLAYLQELVMNAACSSRDVYVNESGDPLRSTDAEVDIQLSNGDTVQMQPTESLTNNAVQVRAN